MKKKLIILMATLFLGVGFEASQSEEQPKKKEKPHKKDKKKDDGILKTLKKSIEENKSLKNIKNNAAEFIGKTAVLRDHSISVMDHLVKEKTKKIKEIWDLKDQKKKDHKDKK
jgi:hypothetical protein